MPKEKEKGKEGKSKFNPLFAVGWAEKAIGFLKRLFTEKLLAKSMAGSKALGKYGLAAAAVLGLLLSLVMAVRANSFIAFLIGVGWVLVVIVAMYVAGRFIDAGEKLIESTSSQLSSTAFLDCFGFLAAIVGTVGFVLLTVLAVQRKSESYFYVGVALLVASVFFAAVAFNPKSVNIAIIKESSAGHEAVGVIAFFLKGALKLIPVVFGVGVVVSAVIMVIKGIGLFGADWRVAAAWSGVVQFGTMAFLFALAPFLGFLLFILSYLGLDVIQSILSVPGKLDKLAK